MMLDVIERTAGGSGLRVLDLCCGPGSISRRVLERFSTASILAVDMDPAHLELGRRTLDERVEWMDADLRSREWATGLEPASFGDVLSATAVHWFQPEEVVALYRALAELLNALRDDTTLQPFVDEGDRRFADKPPGIAASIAFRCEAFQVAGFSTADEVWRHHSDAILVALR
jgi:SAM-dependent methyltransferase